MRNIQCDLPVPDRRGHRRQKRTTSTPPNRPQLTHIAQLSMVVNRLDQHSNEQCEIARDPHG